MTLPRLQYKGYQELLVVYILNYHLIHILVYYKSVSLLELYLNDICRLLQSG